MNYCLFITLHGVEFETLKNGYANEFIDKIRANLTDVEKDYFKTFQYNWTTKTQPRQMQMYEAVEKGLGNQKLRKLKHTIGADIVWSGRAKAGTECFYSDFTEDLTNIIDVVSKKLEPCKVVLFGHSQGSQNALNFIFDYHNHIDTLFTAGSPISMASGMFEDWGRVPSNLENWTNFYNSRDWISSKLQCVHPSKQIADFVKDIEVPSGWNIFNLFGLKAHCIYWKSDTVINEVARQIKVLINS